jgi:hypothetical protein
VLSRETTPGLLASSDINGTMGLGEDGADVGTADHLVVDPVQGRIAFAVSAFGETGEFPHEASFRLAAREFRRIA